jgi:hypothetical protein
MNIFLYHNTSINKSNNLGVIIDPSCAFAGGDEPSKTINRGYYTAARRYDFLSSSGENNILRTSAASE